MRGDNGPGSCPLALTERVVLHRVGDVHAQGAEDVPVMRTGCECQAAFEAYMSRTIRRKIHRFFLFLS